jgi:hypothetical protein
MLLDKPVFSISRACLGIRLLKRIYGTRRHPRATRAGEGAPRNPLALRLEGHAAGYGSRVVRSHQQYQVRVGYISFEMKRRLG